MTLLTKWSFGNRAAIIFLVVMALAMGVMSYRSLPMEFLPEADNPQVTITVIGQGYDAKSMESLVTTPIEDAVALVKGKKDMFSTSGDGFTKIDINFESKTNMKDAKTEVQEAIAQVQLPERVSKPFVVQLNTSMIPISQIAIAFQDGLTKENVDTTEKRIVTELQKINGVGSVALYGKTEPIVMIHVDPDNLTLHNLTAQDIINVLQGHHISASIGEKTIAGQTGNIKVSTSIDNIKTLQSLKVTPDLTLKNVSTITLKTSHDSVSRLNGNEVLYAVVTKDSSANAVTVGNDVQKTVDRLNKEVSKVQMDVFYSTSDMVVTSVNSMLREVLMGALFATVVILLFLRNFRATLITIVSIPLSLGITLYLLQLSGVTLNIITLGGVAVAVGRLVDDSIVVIENIYRKLEKQAFSIQMIIEATKEVSTAITSSTITTVAVFLPMGLLKGSLQAFLLPFALTVTYSLLASLIVALTVVPILSSVLLKNNKMKEHEPSKRFSSFLKWNLNHKWVPLLIAIVLFVGSIATYFALPKGALDSSDASYATVSLSYPSDTPNSKVLEEGKRMEAFLLEQPEPKYVLMQNGNSDDAAKWGNVVAPTKVDFTIIMKKDVNATTFLNHVEEQKNHYPEAKLETSGKSAATVFVDISADDVKMDPKILEISANELMEKAKAVEGVVKVTSNQKETKPVFTFKVDPTLANTQEVALKLQTMLNDIPIGQIKLDDQETTVKLAAMLDPENMPDLSHIMIRTNKGLEQVSSLARVEKTDEASSLFHKDGKPYIRVTAEADPAKLSIVGKNVESLLPSLTKYDGVSFTFGGASAQQADDFAEIGMTGLISIGIVYLIMIITFKTFRAPLAIMCSLPLAAIGSVLGLVISRVTPDFTAMFGALMLIGIVVTNAIVLIDRVKQNEEHMTIRDALIEAASIRMRPILMTAVATICAMLPLLFGKSEEGSIVSKSLAVVVIGGLSAATVLTLVIVPVIYELFFFLKSRRQRKAANTEARHSAPVPPTMSV
ncbi:efflux RND transporter permease subunit [Paenibacillus hexagrammi]|uniref:Efflux RND transporter permease subunit n=1 Tax=Paenibacillus hexagrammi TaxID=2908839 RepID=A0ABY3SQX4_9BACL|nr:efflux RND transporter permease subunit [Paenibacillus sp. YPD9-1]UJF35556.1 efflux RND transporter permease subunit [Paenibacillus sp. YPD9-1]